MGEEADIPLFDFSIEALKQGSEKWKELSDKVREACEVHGCFLLNYNEKISTNLREDMFMAMKTLFDLPEETKKKYQSPNHYSSYMNRIPGVPLRETFGIDNAPSLDVAQNFTNLMWPQGNSSFCDVLNSMSCKMLELNFTIMKMIFDSYGVGKYYNSHTEGTCSVFRPIKYHVPLPCEECSLGLLPHMDSNSLTVLCQNGVQGLEILSKEEKWYKVIIPEGSYIVIVGEMLKAWSNGRLRAVKHKVTMSGNKERYSCGIFTMPKEGVIVEMPQEFVEKEQPILYRPFTYTDYISYNVSNRTANALEVFAGLSSYS